MSIVIAGEPALVGTDARKVLLVASGIGLLGALGLSAGVAGVHRGARRAGAATFGLAGVVAVLGGAFVAVRAQQVVTTSETAEYSVAASLGHPATQRWVGVGIAVGGAAAAFYATRDWR